MKNYFLLILMSGMFSASYAVSIPDMLYDLKSKPSTIAYDRILNDGTTHLTIHNITTPNKGFVLKYGDEIIGYSDSGDFSYKSAPPALLDMLEAFSISNAEDTQCTYTAVSPLVSVRGAIKWNQDSPYNDLCPMYDMATRCPSGCVATAMAQLMYYHRWPEHGKGYHSYQPAIMYGNTLEADFENTTYNWDAMLPDYNTGLTADGYSETESRQAVATLMLHCGVAVDMIYFSQSGATDYDVPPALVNYFDYHNSMAYRKREHYTYSDWLDIIHNELAEGRMVLAYGRATSGGHAFVFDGMDENGYIHVNWGWGGMSNGYFASSALTPASQGIGGSDGGFNYSQRIITGIIPNTPGLSIDKHVEITSTEGLTIGKRKISQGAEVSVRLSGKVTNHGWESSTFDYALMLLDANNDTVSIIPGPKAVTLDKDATDYAPNYGTVSFGVLPEGDYVLYPVCRTSDGNGKWLRIRDSYIGYPNYINVKASSSEISFTAPDYFSLKAIDTNVPEIIYADVPSLITTDIVNEGDVEYHGEVKAVIRNGSTVSATTANYIIDLAPGQSTSIRFTDTFNVQPGTYTLVLIDDDSQPISSVYEIKVQIAPQEGAVSSYSSVVVEKANLEQVSVKANVKVEGGEFNGLLYAFIYSVDGKRQLGCLFPEYIHLDNSEQKTINLYGYFENGVVDTEYLIWLATFNGTKYTFLEDDASTVPFIFAPTGFVDDINIENANEYIYFDILGRTINNNKYKINKLRIKK